MRDLSPSKNAASSLAANVPASEVIAASSVAAATAPGQNAALEQAIFCSAWLRSLCASLDGIEYAVVLLARDDKLVRTASWPTADLNVEALARVLDRAARSGSVEQDETSAGTNGTAVLVGFPIKVGGVVHALLGMGLIQFLGTSSQSVALGDVDGDGDLDIVTANDYSSSSTSVLLNQRGNADDNRTGRGQRDFTYDPVFNKMTGMTDELGRQTLFDLDPANGNVLKTTRVVGELDSAANGENDDVVMSYTYTHHGLIDLMTDPLGRVTDYDYDTFGRMVRVTYAKGTADEAAMQHEYDLAGNQTAVVDANGNRTEYQYDLLNRVTHVTEADPDGAAGPLFSPETAYVYDENGNTVQIIDAAGRITAFAYDALNRLILRTDPDPDGAGPADAPVTSFAYDEQGNLILVTDPLGHVTQNFYDARNRLVRTIDPDGGITALRYDSDDNLNQVTDPLGNVTRYFYDQRDRLTLEIDPLGNRTEYTYDPVDNLIAMTDRNGRVTRFEYDDLDRLVTETWRSSSGATTNTIDYSYDRVGNILSIDDNFSSLSYTYDARDRVVSEDNLGTPDVPHVFLNYSYDDVGNVLSVADSIDGNAAGLTTYTYDALNRMTSLAQTGVNTADKRVDFAFNALGQYTSILRYGDLAGTALAVGTDFTYDGLNRLANIAHSNASGAALNFFDFEYDAQSRITAITDIDGRIDYTYDARDQLTGASHADPANPDETYQYDANGNRIASHLHGAGYVTGPNNRLLSDGTFNYAYDAEGNMIRRTEIATGAVREFDYDQRNRLVRVSDRAAAGGIILREVNFVYDVLNRRIAKVVDANGAIAGGQSALYFAYDREDVILDFADSDGPAGAAPALLAVRYFHGPGIDQVLAQETYDAATGLTSGVQWLLTDHLGTTRDLVDGAGVLVNHVTYGSYGNVVAQSDGAVSSRYMFTGRELDVETGLHYYRARYYDAAIGVFLSEDPIGLYGGLNTYEYALSNPVSRIDPTGLTTLVFNVETGVLTVDPEVPGRKPYDIDATSGKGECENKPKCENMANKGPIPRGRYEIYPSQIDNPSFWDDLRRNFRDERSQGGGDWGDWRVRIYPLPGTQRFGRTGFYLHGGYWDGSAGCIDFGGGIFGNDKLLNDLQRDPNNRVPLLVR